MDAIGSHLVVVLAASVMAFVSALSASVFVIYEINEEAEEDDVDGDDGVMREDGDGVCGDDGRAGFREDEHQPLLLN